ncbi:MAG TPA: DUF6210 family protein [Acidobacteriaceae bacterium]|nr:DUF6210 family protein [Acidobacteriaceae bacterium]
MATQKRVIDLSGYDNLGIILKVQSGVFYTSQVAGYACQHPEIEGAFYPLAVKPGKAEVFSLRQRFKGPWNHIDEADAEFIDGVLHKNGHKNLSVDRTKLDDSYEAWVHLAVAAGAEDMSGFGDCEAVLVWPNSD